MPRQYHLKPKPPPEDHPELPQFSEGELARESWEMLVPRTELEHHAEYTAERIAKVEARYKLAVELLAQGHTCKQAARILGMHPYTVGAIALREKAAIEPRRNDLGDEFMSAARLALREGVAKIAAGEVDGKTLTIASGVWVDKGMLLKGQPTVHVQHTYGELNRSAVDGYWERILATKRAFIDVAEPDPSPAELEPTGSVAQLEPAAPPEVETDNPSDALGPNPAPIEPGPGPATALATDPNPNPSPESPTPTPPDASDLRRNGAGDAPGGGSGPPAGATGPIHSGA